MAVVTRPRSSYARGMTSPEGGRKVAQLRNDVDDIYDILSDIHVTLDQHTAKLEEHTVTLADHGGKLDRILDILETR